MKHAHGHAAHPEAGHHVAKLRNRGVGENAFDVILRDGDERGKNRRRRANPDDDRERHGCAAGLRSGLHQRINTRHQKNAGGNHCGRVNQRGNRRRPLHRIRQPDVQRKLTALARRTAKNQQTDRAGRAQPQRRRLRDERGKRRSLKRPCAVVIEKQRAGLRKEPHNPEQEKHIADARHQKCFLGRGGRCRPLIPEANQQI